MINRSIQHYRKRFLGLNVMSCMAFAVGISAASVQTDCSKNLYDAEKQFQVGNLDSVRSLLNHCLTRYSQSDRNELTNFWH